MTAFPSGGSTTVPAPSFIPSPSVPAGLTLRNTYTTSQTGLTFPRDWVYVVAVGGGGSGTGLSNFAGGGGGACIQGWVRATDLTAVTIGAGGAASATSSGNIGSTTIAGPIRAPGGGGGVSNAQIAAWNVENGAAQGGMLSDSTYVSNKPIAGASQAAAFNIFAGGRATQSSSKPATATSGAGAHSEGVGGDGYQGPGGGGASGGMGGNSTSPNGTTYAGGAGATSNGGGGAGILGSGSDAIASTSAGAGGTGGGGGGGSNTLGGAGGQGAVLVYY